MFEHARLVTFLHRNVDAICAIPTTGQRPEQLNVVRLNLVCTAVSES